VPGSYLIGEERVDALAPGAEAIVKIRWDEDMVPPATVVVAGIPVSWHPCLLAEVSPHDGPGPSPGSHDVKRYNDLAHKNIAIDPAVFSGGFSAAGMVAGTAVKAGVGSMVIDRAGLAPHARVFLCIDDRKLMRQWLQLARESAVKPARELPWRRGRKAQRVDRDLALRVTGLKVVSDLAPGDGGRIGHNVRDLGPMVSVGRVRGREVVFFEGGGADSLELPLPLRSAQYVPLAIGVARPKRGEGGLGVLRATQRLADGELSAGYELRF
jgi:hypothetical protein